MTASQLLLLGGAQAPAVDPFFYSVTSLLHGDGTNGAQNNTFLDSSTNNFTITRNGNTTQGAFSPFSQTGWGNYFDGTGDFLSVADNAALQMGSGNFTIEYWWYPVSLTGYQSPIDKGYTGGGGLLLQTGNGDGKIIVYADGGAFITASTAVTVNAWNHMALVRNGTSLVLYLNGVSVGSATNSVNFNSTAVLGIGSSATTSPLYPINGYLSNFRIVKGTAVYTSNFTPSTTPLTAISGTSILTCQANRFLDASSNAFTIVRSGDVSVQPFSPFNPLTPYSTSAVGGSGYFDGSGDYLDGVSSTSATNFGTSDFTVECWVYFNSVASQSNFIDNIGNSTNSLYTAAGGSLRYFANSINAITGATLVAGQWYHIAVVRSSGTTKLYVNGTQSGSNYTDGTNYAGGSTFPRIGAAFNASTFHNGYITDVRCVKSAVYTAAFTPPSAPLTAISNTSLLLNFTNAGIFDNAADADYETVGNAQISTSVKKYGTGSMSFDGTGDYLTIPYNQFINFGTGDFTIEGWFYLNSFANQYYVLGGTWTTGTSDEWLIQIENNGSLRFLTTANTSFFATGLIKTGTWYHFAASRNAGVIKAYINGTAFATISNTNSIGSTSKVLNIGQQPGGTWPWNGYVDDWRISKGIGRYPYNFTPPTAEFPNIGGTVTLTADPYYEYTTLLLPGNGTNGAQNNTFLDSSTNAFSITRNGNTTQGTFSPFSQTGWGNYFDGTANGSLRADSSADTNLSADFTIQAWVFPIANGQSSNSEIMSRGATTTFNGWHFLQLSGTTQLCFGVNYSGIGNTSTSIQSSTNIPLNQWTHVAVTRSGNTARIYINGSLDTTNTGFTTSPTVSGTEYVYIGRGSYDTTNRQFTGYVSNASIIKGTALTTFDTTTPLSTSTSGQSLLTCTSNRFIDTNTATTAKTLTAGSGASVQAFSPFNPTASWSAATYGGSGYFDGSGDFLACPDNAALEPGSSDLTWEMWINTTSTTQYATLYSRTTASFASGMWSLMINFASGTAGDVALFVGDYSTSVGFLYANTVNVRDNAWHHIAVVRSGSAWTLYVDGVSRSTGTFAGTIADISGGPYVGADQFYGRNFSGYISGFRIVKGTAVYTAGFTPPTAPPTAITNTSLLLNYTNAGIYDATSKNDLETVGNAQISTTQSKFGGSSIAFDGSGDYLLGPWNPPTDLGAGDFTIEFWMYPTAAGQSSVTYLFNLATNANYGPILIGQAASGYGIVLYASSTGSSWNLASGSSFGTATQNAWNHVALTRYGADVRLFLNGIAATTLNWGTTALLTGSSYRPNIGSGGGVANTFYTGYMQDVRMTKGIARYTSNFTPPTTAFLTL